MRILIDRDSQTPVFRQIEAYLRQNIESGGFAPDSRLPSTRQLAHDLGVNRITVENAYAELEADGLVWSRAGSGTYVLPPAKISPLQRSKNSSEWPLWQCEIDNCCEDRLGVDERKTLLAARHAAPIDLAGGSGDARIFPVQDYRRVIQSVLRRDGMQALGYGEIRGYAPLRATIAQILVSQGIPAREDNVLITAGSQQAIALVTQLLLAPGDTIFVENPTYAVALDLFHALRLRMIGIPTDEQGMQVEALERLLQTHHPRLIYTIPNFHNPTGTCMSSRRRQQLIALADRYNIPILEDDYVGDLRYEGRALPALKSLDPGGAVIYASTFSKMLMPGLRVGFLVANGPVYDHLVNYKRVNDLTTSNLHQRALESYMTVGRYQAYLHRTTRLYKKRRDAMVEAIHAHLPSDVRFTIPQGGLFLWLEFPESISASRLLPLAFDEGVSFSPGNSFFPDNSSGDHFLRLNFTSQPPDTLVEGIRRLGKAVQHLLAAVK